MSAIAGYVCRGGDLRPDIACGTMLASLTAFGPDGVEQRCIGATCVGRALHRVVPEDDHDPGPLVGGGGRYLLTADARIDNRHELRAALGLIAADAARLSDAALLLMAWERWQLESLDHVVGDIAFALWDAEKGQLTLCRGPLSSRPLFYHHGSRFLAFASMPAGLLALGQVARRPDFEEIARMSAGGIYAPAPRTMFEGISAVAHGHAVIFAGSNEQIRRIWDINRPLRSGMTVAESGEAMQDALELAVGAQLRRRGGAVACHLSAGRDSGAVATTAAQLMRGLGEGLLAFTGAPRPGFADGLGENWLSDEAELAAATAARHANIDHRVCRPEGNPFLARFDVLHRLHFRPLLNLPNLPWWAQINDEARDEGVSILLMGQVGNFSISVGGSGMLIDELVESGPAGWWRQARRLGGESAAAWRNIANVTAGPYFPASVYRGLMTAAGRDVPGFSPLPLLRGPVRLRAERIRTERFADWRPPKSYRALVRDTLFRIDNADKTPLAGWGIDLRDPTADRRVVELCLSLPADQLMSTDGGRPAFEAAFGDRLPPAVLANRRRGYQGADWFEQFRPDDVRAAFSDFARHPVVREIVDDRAVSDLIDAWPARDGYRIGTIEAYCSQLLGTLSLASFIQVNFPA